METEPISKPISEFIKELIAEGYGPQIEAARKVVRGWLYPSNDQPKQ